jgi:5-hydroxyisourate hydrolase
MAHDSILSTHILDTAQGRPGAGIRVELHRISPEPGLVRDTVTNADGRAAAPLLPEAAFIPGVYELRFHIGPYFAAAGLGADPPYLDLVPVRVTLLAGQGHYHVPLNCSPYGYTTYRGS